MGNKEFVIYQVLAEKGASPCLVAVEGSNFVQQDSWVGWQEKVVLKSDYTAKCREVEELVEAIKVEITILSAAGIKGSAIALKQALEKHQQGEGDPKGGSGE